MQSHYRVTDEAFLADTSNNGPSIFLRMCSLLLNERLFIFLFINLNFKNVTIIVLVLTMFIQRADNLAKFIGTREILTLADWEQIVQ